MAAHPTDQDLVVASGNAARDGVEGREGKRSTDTSSSGNRTRPMLAILADYVERTSGGYEKLLRSAFIRACRRHQFDFTLITGSPLGDPDPKLRVYNEIYDLVDGRHFDGLITVSTGLSRHVGHQGLRERFARQLELPSCSLGMQLDGVPSIENACGIAEAVEHLIVDHGRRQLAFLGACWSAVDIDERRDTFLAVARKHGLCVPPRRMLTCTLEPISGEAAVTRLLEADPHVDAIVAANDGSAFGALRALQRLGMRPGEDVSVTGYDDLPMAQLVLPTLTTVSQPLEAMATAAVDTIARLLRGDTPPALVTLPSKLIQRTSCGCARDQRLSPDVAYLAEAARTAYTERLQLETTYDRILDFARVLSVAADSAELERQIAIGLPSVHAAGCFVGLYSNQSHTELRPILPDRLPDGSPTLKADGSFLSFLGNGDAPRALLVLGLACKDELLGIVGFALDEYCQDYSAICSQLEGAWQLVALREEVVNQTKLTERSIQERQAAADRTRATTALASGVAHDLNNALGSLVSLSDVVCDELEEYGSLARPFNPEVIDDVRTIKSSALRAAETVKDLMTLGRVGRTRHEPFDLVRLTQHLVELEQSALAKGPRRIALTCETDTQSIIVNGSEPHIERAIGNLVRNAVEAVNTGGEIGISVSTIVLDRPVKLHESIPPGSYAVVTVKDNGPGIEQDSYRRVFEPFFSTKRLRDSSGSGLGLAIVHSVVKEHQGYVDVSSQLGLGSRFSLYFPRADVPAAPRPSIVPISGGSARILVVDDDLTQLRTAKRVLTRCGYDVTTLASGARAYELVATELRRHTCPPWLDGSKTAAKSPSPGSSSFDLVILDLALNEEDDGLQLFSKLRRLFPTQKGILASGHAFIDHEVMIEMSNLVWLPKPYTVQSLTLAIQKALRG